MKAGKLPLGLLSKLLAEVNIEDPRVVLGPRPGEDAALIDCGDRYLVAAMDPITFATDHIGSYVVQVNANDIAVMGATPRWLMVTLLLPEGTSSRSVSAIFDQLREACSALGVALVGGHTELTHDLSRPLAIGAMLGEVSKDRAILTGAARPGDAIILTRGIAIEGTAVLARERPDALRAAGVDARVVEVAQGYLFSHGISIVPEARIACAHVAVHAMHDPTEGGLAAGLLEVARAADVGVTVDVERITVLPECETCCRAVGLDPLGLLASGALLVIVADPEAAALIEALEQNGIPSDRIGQVTGRGDPLRLFSSKGERDLPTFERDELARFLSE